MFGFFVIERAYLGYEIIVDKLARYIIKDVEKYETDNAEAEEQQ